MVDADEVEIARLKKKYKKYKNLKFFSDCLGENDANIKFKIFNHKGYNSTKSTYKNTLWFKQYIMSFTFKLIKIYIKV